jgi:hypothetical protein
MNRSLMIARLAVAGFALLCLLFASDTSVYGKGKTTAKDHKPKGTNAAAPAMPVDANAGSTKPEIAKAYRNELGQTVYSIKALSFRRLPAAVRNGRESGGRGGRRSRSRGARRFAGPRRAGHPLERARPRRTTRAVSGRIAAFWWRALARGPDEPASISPA